MKPDTDIKQENVMNIRNYLWVLRHEPNRLWKWWHRHNPFTKKRYSLREAFRAVLENPPCFDITWDEDMEKKYEK